MTPYEKTRAETEARWFFLEADGDAGGIRGVSISVLEEVQEAGGATMSVKSGGRKWIDPYPCTDHSERARRRLRCVSQAMSSLALGDQAVLQARYGTSATRWVSRGGPSGLGDLGWVSTLTDTVQSRAVADGITYIASAREAAKLDLDGLLAESAGLVDAALAHLAVALLPSAALREFV